jgi:uncharacterized DUF497 family protein
MRFEWHEAKRRSNLRRHGFDFIAIEEILSGATVTYLDDRFDYGETRLITLGLFKYKVVAITHTETEEVIRLISIRKASKNEEETYFKEVND